MAVKTPAETFARSLSADVTNAVRRASVFRTADRPRVLGVAFSDVDDARTRAAAIKDEVLENLEESLASFIEAVQRQGVTVHQAATGEDAREAILRICRENPGTVVKGKSMATEEIHLNAALEAEGIEVVETDLGEYVVQIDGDHPSHIVTPIIHKNRRQVADSFLREGLGPYTEEPAELAGQARRRLREKFREASVGISGVNFGIVDSGRLVIVENEGNNRLSTTAPRVHIAVMGIEKLLPSERDLPLFLRLLAGSATGQRVTVYTHFIAGPRRADELDGPEEVHLILLDAGRRDILNSRYRAILRCIRCGACLNVCPVYRQISGHGYGHVYPGPVGAVLAPLLEKKSGRLSQLPKASTLCGSCEEVCPVKIPIPDMLLHLRDENGEKGSWSGFSIMATDPKKWGVAKSAARMGPAIGWSEFRDGPERDGAKFRDWWSERTVGTHGRAGMHRAPQSSASNYEPGPSPPDPLSPTRGEGELWSFFEANLSALGGTVVYVDSLDELDLAEQIGDLWERETGVTDADFAIAETGTLVIHNRPGRERLASLVPPKHIAIVREDGIVPRLEDAISDETDRSSVWITGPSRTADIEGVLVRGVHGPGELTVVVLKK